ncbi:hypothetical protein FRB95_007052 [Tulasnella sp. JGI-2019a]|nr:hypothetical protein FRB95_007052 [Tulasnella sp. JGI-2019a]
MSEEHNAKAGRVVLQLCIDNNKRVAKKEDFFRSSPILRPAACPQERFDHTPAPPQPFFHPSGADNLEVRWVSWIEDPAIRAFQM